MTLAPTLPSVPPPAERAHSLYSLAIAAQEIAGELAAAAELLDDPETEATAIALVEQYLTAGEANQRALSTKADSVCNYIDHLAAVASFRAEQGKRLTALAKADEQRATKLKRYLLDVLTKLQPDATSFSLPTHELTSRKSTRLEILDEDAIPDDLFREVVTRAPDKDAIKAAIKAGQPIPGTKLVTNRNWTIK